jgi:hypothetical protein
MKATILLMMKATLLMMTATFHDFVMKFDDESNFD